MTHDMIHWATISYRESEGRESGRNSLRGNNRESANLCGFSCLLSVTGMIIVSLSTSPGVPSPRCYLSFSLLILSSAVYVVTTTTIAPTTPRITETGSHYWVRTLLQAHPCLHSQTPKKPLSSTVASTCFRFHSPPFRKKFRFDSIPFLKLYRVYFMHSFIRTLVTHTIFIH